MGIYSEIINSCSDLGNEYIGYLQTKDLDGCFDQYWISPDGCLFQVHWPPLRRSEEWRDFASRGKVTPCRFTGLVRFSGSLGRRPVWFIEGRLVTGGGHAWWPIP